ncbi:hypothetical protein [Pulveribacter sp.]|uniref:hypothetical protein n=1 Tax=Pulveribacter sp. TaxID=2678893 RepID=UPI002898F89F|nr:hypothetical protein [Pulveribacter sp.]
MPFPASSKLAATLMAAAAALALSACDPRPADRPLKPTAPPVPAPSAATAPAAGG